MIKLKTLLNESLLDELRVIDIAKGSAKNLKYYFLYKDKLFILDDNSDLARVKKHIKKHPGVDSDTDFGVMAQEDVYEFITRMVETSPDIVAGEYYADTNSITVFTQGNISPKTSINVKKVAKQLRVDKVSFSQVIDRPGDAGVDDDWKEYSPHKLIGDIPSIVFHGTNTPDLKSMLRYGLDPGRGTSKWGKSNIYHEEHNFFTANFNDATGYAMHAVRQDKDESRWENFPIVLELQIPDKNLVQPDYDADLSTTTPRTFPIFQHGAGKPISTMKAMGISRETGKWSYKGRIPAAFIRWVYYYNVHEKVWHKSRPDTWRKLLDRYDWETLNYKLGLGDM